MSVHLSVCAFTLHDDHHSYKPLKKNSGILLHFSPDGKKILMEIQLGNISSDKTHFSLDKMQLGQAGQHDSY